MEAEGEKEKYIFNVSDEEDLEGIFTPEQITNLLKLETEIRLLKWDGVEGLLKERKKDKLRPFTDAISSGLEYILDFGKMVLIYPMKYFYDLYHPYDE